MQDFQKRFRDSEGNDQLDMFPTPKKPNWFWRNLPAIVVGIFILIMFLSAAKAQEGIRGDGHPEYHDIYKTLHNTHGTHCCDDGDCRKTTAKYIDGQWYAKLEGVWYKMEDSRRTLQYPYSWSDTAHICASPNLYIFCFVPPGAQG